MYQRVMYTILRAIVLATLCLFSAGCGEDSEPESSYDPIELRELASADDSKFDVDWKPGTVVADESHVLASLDNLQPHDGVFRVPSASPLLEGLSVGSIVVWPQVGIFEIVELRPEDHIVEIGTKWAKLSDAASRADISFRHALRAGEPGRAVGVQPALTTPAQQDRGIVIQPFTVESGPLSYSEDGVKYEAEAGGIETELSVKGDTVSASFSSSIGGTSVGISGSISGISADGVMLLNEGDEDPAVRIDFKNVKLTVAAELSVKGAKGESSVIPPAQMTFPFLIGPIPAYIAVGTDIQVESSIGSSDDLFSLSAGFTLTGDIVISRNSDGSFGAEGQITGFDTQTPQFSSSIHLTSGVAIRFSAPRLTFGIGRPGLANGGVYGKKSIEFVANTVLDPYERTTCAKISTGSAAFVGGELSFLGWSISNEAQITSRDGIDDQKGELCK